MSADGEQDWSVDPPRYRDYLRGTRPPEPTPERVPDPYFQDAVYVSRDEGETWEASWQGEFAVLAEFTGSKTEVIAWARTRSPRVWLYSADHSELTTLDPTD